MRSRQRICIITPAHSSASMGGSEYQIDCLLDALIASKRFEIFYLAAMTSKVFQPLEYEIIPIGNENRIPKLGFLMHAQSVLRTLNRVSPDVIYQRVACGYTGLAAYFAKRSNARLIWHVSHDSDVGRTRLDHGRNFVRRFLERQSINYGIRHADRIVVQTVRQSQLLQKYFGREADAVIPNFHPEPTEEANRTEGPISVLWIANMKPWKNPEAFVRLAQGLSDLKNVRFIMVGAPSGGAGDQSWSKTLFERIAATPNLSYLGPKTQQETNELLAQSHVFVNTSLEEGFPNTFIQAWMRRIPIVSLHVDPDGVFSREHVGICAGSEERLQEAVRMLVAKPESRSEYGARGQLFASKHHSLRNAQRLIKLIDDSHDGVRVR